MPARPPASALPSSTLRRRVCLAALIATGLSGSAGCAAPAPARDGVDGRWLGLEVVDRDDDQSLRVWHHRGDAWVAGAPGERYALRVTNRSGERLLAVVSVDGVNIVTGETASAGQRGYVLAPWQSTLLTGWRKSDSEVAAFEFTRLPQSYAALTGRPGDVGVIGVAVFREAPRPVAIDLDRRHAESPDQPPAADARASALPPPAVRAPAAQAQAGAAPGAETKASPLAGAETNAALPAGAETRAAPAPATPAKAADSVAGANAAAVEPASRARPRADERLGTGHGPRESSWVTTVPFERATATPEELLQLRYDRLDNLVAAGIVPRSYAAVPPWRSPRAFPGDDSGAGFVPDPPSR
jgi:hypothetical protein